MIAFNGSLVLLKIKENTEIITIGGMRTTKFSLDNALIDASHKESGAWRELLPRAGTSHVTIAGNGVFIGEMADKTLTKAAFANEMREFAISFAGGELLQGKFHIANYERTGNYNEEEGYSLVLESTGKVEYVVS